MGKVAWWRWLSVVAVGGAPVGAQSTFTDVEINVPLDQAVGITFAADGRGFIWEKAGRVWIFENGVRSASPLVNISEEVGNWVDHGLLGFALDPNFLSNGHIYLMYAVDHHYLMNFGTPGYSASTSDLYVDTIGRVTRFTCNPADGYRSVLPGSRLVLLGETPSTGIPICNQSHGAGTLAFGQDGSLIVSHGDGASFVAVDEGGPQVGGSNTALLEGILSLKEDVGAFRAQLVDSLSGKILRLDPATGNGLPGNPFYDALYPRSPRSRVWALGLRNPFRLCIRPGTGNSGFPGVMYLGDVGWFDWEELDVCTQGGQNFGWPIYEGMIRSTRYPSLGPSNLDAPNPLMGIGSCSQPYFRFGELLIHDTLSPPGFPNPCESTIQIPPTVPRFVHRRPALAWHHNTPDVSVPTYNGNDPAMWSLGSPNCPVEGSAFTGACSIGGLWYASGAYPAMFNGTYFHADWEAGWIKNLVFDSDNHLTAVRPVITGADLVVCLAFNPADGKIYFLRFDYTGACHLRRLEVLPDLPPVVVAAADRRFGQLPLTVQFSSAGSYNPEGGGMTYHWDFGDGQTSNDPAPTHVYTGGPGPIRYDAALTVTDSGGQSATASLPIWGNNTPPTITLTSPPQATNYYRASNPFDIPLLADVDDAESPANLTCEWLVLLHHDEHIHPQPVIDDCAGMAHIEPHVNGDDTYYYEFRLTVTDPQGLGTVAVAAMFPACPVDLDDGTNAGISDGGVDVSDLLFFLSRFEAGNIAADLDGDGDPASGDPDGGVDVNDLLFFLARFEAGC
jgi:glucose/arabinose dehydrogenase